MDVFHSIHTTKKINDAENIVIMNSRYKYTKAKYASEKGYKSLQKRFDA